ncbi:MAG TPA: hypothetical protein VJ184_16140, partial [Chryseolinea sp.]|nr:hypothetical protein [Chryseolinea sp.]
MKVFKFGGASLKNAHGVQQVASIILSHRSDRLLVVVSAMGKTTNALELILKLAVSKKDYYTPLEELKQYHYSIVEALFENPSAVQQEVSSYFLNLESELVKPNAYDQIYDQIVCMGELISSVILHHYLLFKNIASYWHDARASICTDKTFREGKVDWLK